eukprot:3093619-Rhodomonas_salina.2
MSGSTPPVCNPPSAPLLPVAHCMHARTQHARARFGLGVVFWSGFGGCGREGTERDELVRADAARERGGECREREELPIAVHVAD